MLRYIPQLIHTAHESKWRTFGNDGNVIEKNVFLRDKRWDEENTMKHIGSIARFMPPYIQRAGLAKPHPKSDFEHPHKHVVSLTTG
jgi:hypothetical protein